MQNEDGFGDNPEGLIDLLWNLGDIFYYQGRFSESEYLYFEVIALLEGLYGKNDESLILALNDIANALFCSLTKFKSNEIYNISDDKPESQEEVAKYGSKLLGIIEPKPLEIDQIESEMLKGFYKDSKKVNNKKMKDFFEYKLKYPTYIEGLNYIFNNKI